MRSLLFHCKNYEVKLDRLANRPINIKPEAIKERSQKSKDCIVTLVTIERDDVEEFALRLVEDIKKMCKEVNRETIVILPFGHLSNNLARSENAIKLIDLIEKELSDYKILRAHFGSHKSLLLDIYGHPGNARYREYY